MRTALLKEYIKDDPNDPFLRYALALEYINSGQEKEALELLTYVRERFRDYLPNYYQLGSLQLRLGHTEEGLETLNEGIRLATSKGDHHTAAELRALLDEYRM